MQAWLSVEALKLAALPNKGESNKFLGSLVTIKNFSWSKLLATTELEHYCKLSSFDPGEQGKNLLALDLCLSQAAENN